MTSGRSSRRFMGRPMKLGLSFSVTQKAPRVVPRDARLDVGGETRGRERADGIVEAHVERIVAADHHAIGAELLDDELQVALAVAQRVDPDAARVLAGLLRNGRRACGTDVTAVVQ